MKDPGNAGMDLFLFYSAIVFIVLVSNTFADCIDFKGIYKECWAEF